ncbi:hypothetical protein D3C86_1103870 [compost metagenome]
MRPARRFILGVLQVIGQDDRGDATLAQRGAHRPVNQVSDLRGHRSLLHESTGDILEHRQQIKLLLVVTAKRCASLLADNRQDGHVIHPRIVEPGDQV